MVKGTTRQVIVVASPDPKLFEQAIFILREDAVEREGVTDEQLLQQARQAIREPGTGRRRGRLYGPVWACAGALATAAVWLLTVLV